MCAEPLLFTLLTPTAHRHTTPTSSLNLRIWHDCVWVSSATEMRQTTGARWAAWPGGAVTTISIWMWRRQRRLSLTSGKCTLCMPSDHQWCDRGERWAAPSSWVYTSQRDLSWTKQHCSTSQEAQQRLYFLRKLRRARAPAPIMCTFYRGTIESILTSCITVVVWRLQRVLPQVPSTDSESSWEIVGVSLPSLQDIYSTRLTRKPSALQVIPPTRHPLVQSATIREETAESPSQDQQTERQLHPQAVRKLNSLPSLPPLPSLTPRTTELWPPPPPPPTHPPHAHTHIFILCFIFTFFYMSLFVYCNSCIFCTYMCVYVYIQPQIRKVGTVWKRE